MLAALGHQAQSARDFLIGLDLAAKVAAEAVLVELFVRRHVPQAAAVGADLVGEADAAEIASIQTPEFERSEERRVGTEWVGTLKSGRWREHYKKKHKKDNI